MWHHLKGGQPRLKRHLLTMRQCWPHWTSVCWVFLIHHMFQIIACFLMILQFWSPKNVWRMWKREFSTQKMLVMPQVDRLKVGLTVDIRYTKHLLPRYFHSISTQPLSILLSVSAGATFRPKFWKGGIRKKVPGVFKDSLPMFFFCPKRLCKIKYACFSRQPIDV